MILLKLQGEFYRYVTIGVVNNGADHWDIWLQFADSFPAVCPQKSQLNADPRSLHMLGTALNVSLTC